MEMNLPLWIYYVLGFPLLLGPLVTIHELGHYLVGRWFGVHAEAFSVGFGREIWGFTDKRGTRWKLSALPLGGYVQFKGDMNPASIPDPDAAAQASAEERAGSFHHAALWKRALIVFAGPATNILLTLAIFAGFFTLYGKPVPADAAEQLTVAEFAEISPARAAGIEVGDRIVAIEGERMEDFRDVQDSIMLYPGRTLDVTVERDGAERIFEVPVRSVEMEDRFGNVSKVGLIGIASGAASFDFEPQGPIGHRPRCSNAPVGLGGECEKERFTETLPGGVSHSVLNIEDGSFGDNTPVFTVPEGHYFVMGDNRDNSQDSRFPQSIGGVGFVPYENIIGRADRIMFSSAGERMVYFWTWRADRFFRAIE